jgi:branched-chain amino acid transport system substrate-binding protein
VDPGTAAVPPWGDYNGPGNVPPAGRRVKEVLSAAGTRMARSSFAWLPLVALLLAAGCGRKATPDPVLMGHLAPLSGPDKAAGEYARQAIQLAVEELNQPDNRIAGRPLNVLHADTKGDPDTAQREAVRLMRVNGVLGLLGGTIPGTAERLAKASQPYGIPVLTVSAFTAAPPAENVVVFGIPPAERGQVLARYVAQDLKLTRVAVVADSRGPLYAATAAGFVRDFPKDATGRLEEFAYKSDAEWSGLVESLKKAVPQAVLVAAEPGDFLRLRKQLLGSGAKPAAFLFGGSDESPAEFAREPSEGGTIYYVTSYAGQPTTDAGKKFAEKYQDKFKEPPDVHAVLAYDGLRLLFDALRRSKLASVARAREELAKMEDFDGLTGKLAVTKERTVRRPLFVVGAEGGKVRVARSDTPGGK